LAPPGTLPRDPLSLHPVTLRSSYIQLLVVVNFPSPSAPNHQEFNAFSVATEHIKFFRHYLAWLGYPKQDSTPLATDSALAFRILTAPQFHKNSKKLLVQDRNVREAYKDKIITHVHVLSKGFATDLNTKQSGPTDFIAKRATFLTLRPIQPSPNTSKFQDCSLASSIVHLCIGLHEVIQMKIIYLGLNIPSALS